MPTTHPGKKKSRIFCETFFAPACMIVREDNRMWGTASSPHIICPPGPAPYPPRRQNLGLYFGAYLIVKFVPLLLSIGKTETVYDVLDAGDFSHQLRVYFELKGNSATESSLCRQLRPKPSIYGLLPVRIYVSYNILRLIFTGLQRCLDQ